MDNLDIKFYNPEVGLDEAKTAQEHYKDLRYYMADENIPAIEKIQDICQQVGLNFESQMCAFAKEAVECEKIPDLDFNTGYLKMDMMESLKETGSFYAEMDSEAKGNNLFIDISANMGRSEDMDNANVHIMTRETKEIDGEERELVGSGSVSFEKFKNMSPSGFDVDHGSVQSLVNEIRFYANDVTEEKGWNPSSNGETKTMQKNNSIQKDDSINR